MAVFRVNKTENYTVMSNHHLREKDMSLKAKGLLSLMLSLPDDWDYSIDGLRTICCEGKTTIKEALTELKLHGYIVIDKITPDKTRSGRIEYIYNIYEHPQKTRAGKQALEKQATEIQALEKQATENPPQINTNIQNTEKQNKDILNTDISKGTTFYKPTLDEVKAYCRERQSVIDPEAFFDFYEARGWMMGRSPMQNWRAAIRNWERRSFAETAVKAEVPQPPNGNIGGFDMERYAQMVDTMWDNKKPPPK